MTITAVSDFIVPSYTVVQPFELTIKFTTSGPEFSNEPTSQKLECDSNDSGWSMDIPDVYLDNQLNAIVKLDP